MNINSKLILLWEKIRKSYKQIWVLNSKHITAIVIIVYVIYYIVEGYGQAVFMTFSVSDAVLQEIGATSEHALTKELLVEIERLRHIQSRAMKLSVNIVRGLEGFRVEGEISDFQLSVPISMDYNEIISNTDIFDWGYIQLPIRALLRPFQRIIGQNVIELTLHRLGSNYTLIATDDNGGTWKVEDDMLQTASAEVLSSGERLGNLLNSLAFAIMYVDGKSHSQQLDISIGLHLHAGIQHLVEYYTLPIKMEDAVSPLLEAAADEFEQVLKMDPENIKARYNRIIVNLERLLFARSFVKSSAYNAILREVKSIAELGSGDAASVNNLLVATYALQAQAYFNEKQYQKAINSYKKSLSLIVDNSLLAAYIHNNIGLTLEALGLVGEASNYYKMSLELKPAFVRAYTNFANIAMAQQKYAVAEKLYLEAMQKNPGYYNGFYNLALLYKRMNAEDMLKRVSEDERECLKRQAATSLLQFVQILERKEVSHNLTKKESRSLQAARKQLKGFIKVLDPAPEKWQIQPLEGCLAGS